MSPFIDASFTGLGHVFSWPGILIPILGTVLAMATSFLPGVGSAGMIALVLVLTVDWDPVSIMLLFGALTGGATFMGSITGILFNIPGSAPSAAALLDGYPLGQRGYPKMAIAAAATASAVGSIFGVVVLMAILPFIRPMLLMFGPFEMFLLGIWGLTTLIAVPNSSPLKATVMCLLGFLVAMVGTSPSTGDPRWTFGSIELLGGIPMIPVLLGIFTFSELIGWARRYQLKDSTFSKRAPDDSVLAGIASVFIHWGITLRSSVIGTVVGVIPGVGGTVASFVAYGQAAQGVRNKPNEFGNGDVRGLIAPEAAVDAKDGGSLLPVVAFGLPGSESGAVLLAVLAIHGIVPGIPMLTDQLPLTYTLIFALLFSNILTSVVGVTLAPTLARLKDLRVDRLVLPTLVISVVAVLQINGQISDLFVAIGFGIFGYFLKTHDWPRVPFLIAFVLGGFLEANLALSTRLIELDRIDPLSRPQSLVILAMIVVSLFVMGRRRERRAKPLALPSDLPIAAIILTGLVIMALVAIADGYSTLSIGIAVAAVAATVVMTALSWRAGGRSLRLEVPESHRHAIVAMLVIPFLVVGIGLGPTIAAVILGWMILISGGEKPAFAKAGVVAMCSGVAVHLFTDHVAHMILSKPLVLALF